MRACPSVLLEATPPVPPFKQTTDDTLNGQTVADGNRGQVVAVGPFVRYRAAGIGALR